MLNISWKDLLHYGAAGVCVAAGGLTELGVQLPGVTVTDPKLAVAAGLGIFVAGLKGGLTSGKAVIAFLAVALAAPSAMAADLPLPGKAPFTLPAPSPCTLTLCNGPYGGLNMFETGGDFDLIGGGLNGIAQNNFAIGAQLGYEFYNGSWRLGFEAGGDYGVVQNGALPGGGNKNLWSADELVCVGYSLAPLFGVAATNTSTSVPTPTLPTALLSSLMSPCALIGAWERPWGTGFAAGARASALIAKNWTVDIDYIHVNYNNVNINPILSEQTENIVRAGINYHF